MDITDTKHVRFYYLRDDVNAPFGCVCTIRTDDNKFSRGVSLCNFLRGDRFSKTIGRNIAFSRAMKAFERGSNVKSVTYGLSDYLIDKLEYIWNKYDIGMDNESFSLININADIELTSAEKSMWKDILDPNFK